MLERIDLEAVSERAERIHVGRALLTLLVGFFWLVGWAAGKLAIGVTVTVTSVLAAIQVGWEDAHKTTTVRPRRRVGTA